VDWIAWERAPVFDAVFCIVCFFSSGLKSLAAVMDAHNDHIPDVFVLQSVHDGVTPKVC